MPENVGISHPVDSKTNSLSMVCFAKKMIHDGKSFSADTVKTAITSGEYIAIGFTTPAATSGRVYLIFGFVAEAKAHIELLEGSTNTTGSGSALTPTNRFRDSGNATILTNLTEYDNAGIAGGTEIHHLYTFSDKKQTFGENDHDMIILQASTNYAVRLSADANGGGQILLNWFEHIDSN